MVQSVSNFTGQTWRKRNRKSAILSRIRCLKVVLLSWPWSLQSVMTLVLLERFDSSTDWGSRRAACMKRANNLHFLDKMKAHFVQQAEGQSLVLKRETGSEVASLKWFSCRWNDGGGIRACLCASPVSATLKPSRPNGPSKLPRLSLHQSSDLWAELHKQQTVLSFYLSGSRTKQSVWFGLHPGRPFWFTIKIKLTLSANIRGEHLLTLNWTSPVKSWKTTDPLRWTVSAMFWKFKGKCDSKHVDLSVRRGKDEAGICC